MDAQTLTFFFVTSLIVVNIILFAPIDSYSLSQLFLCYQGKNRKTTLLRVKNKLAKECCSCRGHNKVIRVCLNCITSHVRIFIYSLFLFLANDMLLQSNGKLAHMIERSLCMREILGSMSGFSIFISLSPFEYL